jgi:hypothetical protein
MFKLIQYVQFGRLPNTKDNIAVKKVLCEINKPAISIDVTNNCIDIDFKSMLLSMDEIDASYLIDELREAIQLLE